MLFSEAILKFNNWKYLKVKKTTIQGYDLSLRNLCIFLRDCEIENIKLEQILEYLHWEVRMGFRANTLEKKVLAFREFFEFFKRQDYEVIDWRLIPMPRKEFVFPRVASEASYRKLISVIPKNTAYYDIRNLALINMLWDSGARLGELISLNVPDVNLKEQKAIIKTEKTRGLKPFRQIFWKREANSNLIKWIDTRTILGQEMPFEEPDALFVSIKGGCVVKKGLVRRLDLGAAGEALRKYSNRAGLPCVLNAHSIRHAMGHELAKKGMNNSGISDILGHSSLASSFRYTSLSGKELEEVYRGLFGK